MIGSDDNYPLKHYRPPPPNFDEFIDYNANDLLPSFLLHLDLIIKQVCRLPHSFIQSVTPSHLSFFFCYYFVRLAMITTPAAISIFFGKLLLFKQKLLLQKIWKFFLLLAISSQYNYVLCPTAYHEHGQLFKHFRVHWIGLILIFLLPVT